MLQLENRPQAVPRQVAAVRRSKPMPTLTRNQQMIHEKLLSLGRAAGAYELLDLLRDQGVNAAPTVYRALRELEEKGLAHHLVATRQFIALAEPQPEGMNNVMLVCERCHSVMPLEDRNLIAVLDRIAANAGFEVQSYHLELIATCAACRCGAKKDTSS